MSGMAEEMNLTQEHLHKLGHMIAAELLGLTIIVKRVYSDDTQQADLKLKHTFLDMLSAYVMIYRLLDFTFSKQ